MRKIVVVAVMIFSIFVGYAGAFEFYKGAVTIRTGSCTGKMYLELEEEIKIHYAAGLVDGFLGSVFFGAKDIYVENFVKCIDGMGADQVAAILTKYLKDHPEEWNMPAYDSMYGALLKACRNR